MKGEINGVCGLQVLNRFVLRANYKSTVICVPMVYHIAIIFVLIISDILGYGVKQLGINPLGKMRLSGHFVSRYDPIKFN
jgi:hypothetical protein